MGFKQFVLQLTLTKDELISLLFTDATIDAVSSEGEALPLHGCLDFQRYGIGKLGDKAGSTLFFNTYLTYQGRSTRARVRVQSTESDEYKGTISFDVSQNNQCE